MSVSDFCISLESTVDRECITNLGTSLLNTVLVVMVFVVMILICSEGSSSSKRRRGRLDEHNSRWILTFCLVAVHLFELADSVMVMLRRDQTLRNLHPLFSALSSLVMVAVATYFYHNVERSGKVKILSVLLIFWPCVVALKMAKLVILYEKGLLIKHVTLQTTWAGLVAYLAIFAIELSLFSRRVSLLDICRHL